MVTLVVRFTPESVSSMELVPPRVSVAKYRRFGSSSSWVIDWSSWLWSHRMLLLLQKLIYERSDI